MRPRKVLPLILIGVFLVVCTGCDFLDQLKQGIYNTASQINSVQAIGSSKEFAFVSIEYIFTGTGITADQVVFGREGSEKRDTVNITVTGTVYADADTLEPNSSYSYYMWLLENDELTPYDTVEVTTLPILEVNLPADTLFDDFLRVNWDKLTTEDKEYLDYKVSVYDVELSDVMNPEAFLVSLGTPLDSEDVSITESDSEGEVTLNVSPPALIEAYAVVVSTQSLLGPLVNKSSAIKPLVWAPMGE